MHRVVKYLVFLGGLFVSQIGWAHPPCEDLLVSEGRTSSSDIQRLRAEINSLSEDLTEHLLACGANRQSFKREFVLAGAVCGVASRWLMDQLIAAGFLRKGKININAISIALKVNFSFLRLLGINSIRALKPLKAIKAIKGATQIKTRMSPIELNTPKYQKSVCAIKKIRKVSIIK